MKGTLLNKLLLSAIVLVLAQVAPTLGQPAPKRNSPFSPNPKKRIEASAPTKTQLEKVSGSEKIVKIEAANKESAGVKSDNGGRADTEKPLVQNAEFASGSIAKKTLDVAKRAGSGAASPTEIYKVGVGDVLFISLQNAPSKESTYFTVLKDGTIDYPLAGEMVSVAGLTSDEIENALQEKIKLYETPQVAVKVREHNSHTFTVLGMVEKPGEKSMQREAMPLYVVRAEAIVQPKANRAVIKRAGSLTETVDLKDKKYEDVLIFAGDIIEFDSAESDNSSDGKQFYYIGGEIASGGQKDFLRGITLTQAILASGGLKKQSVKKVTIRRKNEAGMLAPTTYDLKAIKDGKAPDPILAAGDTIEIGN